MIIAKLDRLTRSVMDLCALLELFEKRGVALISAAESLDTGFASGRLVITLMGAVSQVGERGNRGAGAGSGTPQTQQGATSRQPRLRLPASRRWRPPRG